MSKNKKLLILLLAFAVLLGGYFVLQSVMEKQEQAEEQVDVMQMNTQDIKKITWNDGSNSHTLILENGVWQYEGDGAFPVDQQYPEAMLKSLSDIKAQRTVEAGADLSEYGLDQPSFTIIVTKSDNSTNTFAVGNSNDVANASYMRLDDGNVFMIGSDFVTVFDYAKEDIMLHDQMPEVGEAYKIEVSSPDNTITAEKFDDSWKVEDTVVDTGKVEQVLTKISQIDLTECDTYQADEAAKEKYGVTENTGTKVTVFCPKDGENAQQVTFYIGNDASNQYHIALKDSKLIYKINETEAEAIASMSLQSLQADETDSE